MQITVRNAFFGALLFSALALTFFLFLPYLVTLSIAGALAVMLHPVHRFFLKRTRDRATLSAILTVLLTGVIIFLPLTLLLVQIGNQAADLYLQLTEGGSILPADLIRIAEEALNRFLPATVNLSSYAGQALSLLTGSISTVLSGTFGTFVQFFLGIMAYYYMLKDGESFIRTMIKLSPLTDGEDSKILKRLRQSVDSVVKGSLIIAFVQGVASGIGFAMFGIPYAALLGAVAGVAAFIPTLGPSTVIFPAAVYLMFTGSLPWGIGLMAWGILAVGLIDNLLHPMLVGRGSQIHPFFILFSVVGGIVLFGFAGFILGPLVISFLLALLDIYRKDAHVLGRD